MENRCYLNIVFSGIKFYNECGFLSLGTKDSQYLRNISDNAKALCHEVKQLSYSQLLENYPYMSFEPNDEGLLSPTKSGYINPRPLVKAQIELAKHYGCEVSHTIVDYISENEPEGHLLGLADGRKLQTKRVILATGGFTFSRPLMPGGIDPNLRLHPNTVILVRGIKCHKGRVAGPRTLNPPVVATINFAIHSVNICIIIGNN